MAVEIIKTIIICQLCINDGKILLPIDPTTEFCSEILFSNICVKCKKILSDFNVFNNRCIITSKNIETFRKLSKNKLKYLLNHRVV